MKSVIHGAEKNVLLGSSGTQCKIGSKKFRGPSEFKDQLFEHANSFIRYLEEDVFVMDGEIAKWLKDNPNGKLFFHGGGGCGGSWAATIAVPDTLRVLQQFKQSVRNLVEQSQYLPPLFTRLEIAKFSHSVATT